MPVVRKLDVMRSRVKPHDRSMAKLSPVATAPPSGTVLERAADAVLVVNASRKRRPRQGER